MLGEGGCPCAFGSANCCHADQPYTCICISKHCGFYVAQAAGVPTSSEAKGTGCVTTSMLTYAVAGRRGGRVFNGGVASRAVQTVVARAVLALGAGCELALWEGGPCR